MMYIQRFPTISARQSIKRFMGMIKTVNYDGGRVFVLKSQLVIAHAFDGVRVLQSLVC